MKMNLSLRQKSILCGCFLVYTAAYLCRANLSPALSGVASSLSLSGTQAGMIASCFGVAYATGQLINGSLADRLRFPYMMIAGLTGSIITNLVFSTAQTHLTTMCLWFVNGCFQSMIWTPMLRTVSDEFEGKTRDNAFFLLSFTLVLGYLLAWLVAGFITGLFGWRISFQVTSLFACILMMASIALFHEAGLSTSLPHNDHNQNIMHPRKVLFLVFRTDLWLFLLCGFVNGYIRDGIMTWGPKMLSEIKEVNLSGQVMTSLIVPFLSIIGISYGKKIYATMGFKLRQTLMVLFVTASISLTILGIFFEGRLILSALILGVCAALCYGANPLLTSITPMRYSNLGRTATAGGLMDAMIYVGSALTSIFTGMIMDRAGWQPVILVWAALDIVGLFLLGSTLRIHYHNKGK